MVSRALNTDKPSRLPPVVVGVADHTGWANLVSVAAPDGRPIVVDRRRVPLIEKGVPSQPYEHDTQALPAEESEQLLRRVKRSVAARTRLAFEYLAADLSPRYRVSSIAIRHPPLKRLPATVAEVHASYYTQCRADGMLYHLAICDAIRQRRWKVHFHHRGEELANAAEALGVTIDDAERFVDGLKKTLKPPWTAEYRHAFAAAVAALKAHATVSL